MDEKTILRTRSRIAWMGRHSGYDRGCDFLESGAQGWRFVDVYRRSGSLGPMWRRYLDRRRRGCSNSPTYDTYSYLLERDALRSAAKERPDVVHLMYLEKDFGLLVDRSRTDGCALIATAHQPRSWWTLAHGNLEVVRSLDGIVALTDREAEFWEEVLPGRVFVAPHGVDVEFFCPAENPTVQPSKPRCLIVGHWLRDLRTLTDVVDLLLERHPAIGFDFVIPIVARSTDALLRIARHDSVVFHAGLSDEELRDLYRRSALLLLPMLDATANNAILEAQACGTPIVSNDVPGVVSYVDSSFADLLPVGDVDGIVDAVIRIVESDGERERRGRAARAHALDHLSWQRLAPRMLEAYEDVLQRAE
jgi:glycosyltransferase involved in cell wall biosynthesis